ncbi:hypothetical protein KKF81_03745 [Candidatus Micrarchaeota archaeon]|nr:hypothetical protein [Candidatus Micrarchaeota archaeon]
MVVVARRIVYETTNDVKRMLTSGQIARAIIDEVRKEMTGQKPDTNIRGVVPVRAATSMKYDKGAKTATIWNEYGNEEEIGLPLEDGWRKSDGNPFGVPNGELTKPNDPNAIYLKRYQDESFDGPVGFGNGYPGHEGRVFYADGVWSYDLGVVLINSEATAPLITVPKEEFVRVTDPEILVLKAKQLEDMTIAFDQKFTNQITPEIRRRFVTEPLETAKILREIADNIKSICCF